ncbi:MAG: P1 family peptidase [Deltaproteobacteria bacterium]|nr:P1 family peptidase [Deltaproteobacteria bacterium]
MRDITCAELPSVVRVGHATDNQGLTGCTAIVFPKGAVCGHAVAGVATGSRELPTTTPRHSVERIHGVVFCGGSAFGLAAADGVMRELEAVGIGHQTGKGLVPIVPAAVVYDLHIGDPTARPDAAMGAAAAREALGGGAAHLRGNVGAGIGVSAGKLLGPERATKTGIGQAGVIKGDLVVAALAVVNPVGEVHHMEDGRLLAGVRQSATSNRLVAAREILQQRLHQDPLHHNTTLAVVATTAKLSRTEACWIAEQSTVALARHIEPPFTRHDGDVLFAASVGDEAVELHFLAMLVREALGWALTDACLAAKDLGGLPACGSLEVP